MAILRVAILAALLPLSACAVPAEPESTAVSAGRCVPQQCGTPPAVFLIECVDFWELNWNGLPNDHGIKLVTAQRADGAEMKLIAELDRLRGVDPVTGAPLADHQALAGTVITISAGGIERELVIAQVAEDEEHFFVGSQAAVEAYDIVYTPPGEAKPQTTRMIAFTGDTYDPVTQQVHTGPTTLAWINFACKDSILYRMHMLGHTKAAQIRLGIPTTTAKRQTVMNALTMNACGTGASFTTLAEPITLSESQNLIPSTSPYQAPPVTAEAIWDASGAVCLDTPRLANSAAEVVPMRLAIEAACGHVIPSCSALIADWPAHGDAVTGNPAGSSP